MALDGPFSPGLVTSIKASEAANEMHRDIPDIYRRLNENDDTGGQDLAVKLTAYDSATGYYSWTRQIIEDGVREDWPMPVEGSPTFCPAVTPNGEIISTFPHQCWIRKVSFSPTVAAIYEVVSGTPTGVTGWVHFSLSSALTTAQDSKAGCPVVRWWGGVEPGATVTVYNLSASSNYIFSGASGNRGLATWDDTLSLWQIVQMECP